jgi:glutamine amidotransferase
MSAKKSIARFLELRKQYPEGYAMWHARYATHGAKNEQNCHPFMVGGDERTYLAHNGVLDISIGKSDKRSDTRVFAEDTLPRIGGVSALDDDNVWIMAETWAKGSKIAILTVDPAAKHPMYLLNESSGSWDNEGIWWSNQSHKRSTYAIPTKVEAKDYDDKLWDYAVEVDLELCPFCESATDVTDNPYYCNLCQSCYDCGIMIDDCLCYTPNKNWQSIRSLADFQYDY